MQTKRGKWIKYAAASSAALIAAVGAGAYLTTMLLVKTALDREQPKIMKKRSGMISGGRKDEKFEQMCAKAAESLKSLNHETVRITGHDNVKLIGHFFPCENAKRIIVAFHGWRSSWDMDYGMIAPFWHENGCSVLYAEQRGQNNSGGEYMGFGLTERFDCIDWINWVNENIAENENMSVYLAGISMGATTVLMASDLKLAKNVRGIMADCGFTSPKEIWRHVARNNLHISYGLRSVIADIICKNKISMASDEYSTLNALKRTKIPVLFIHGTDDCFVPVEMTYENYKACASEKKLLVVPGADHAMSYYVNKDEYEKATEKFWAEFDKKAEI